MSKHPEFTKAINEMVRLKNKNKRLRRKELNKAINLGIEALDVVIAELSNHRGFGFLSGKSWSNELDEVALDLKKFQTAFIDVEMELLADENITEEGQKIILRQVREVRKHQVKTNKLFIPDTKVLLDSIKDIKRYLVSLRELLEIEKEDEYFSNKHDVEKQFRKILYLVGASIVVAIDVPFAASNPVASTLSITFGGGVIGKYL